MMRKEIKAMESNIMPIKVDTMFQHRLLSLAHKSNAPCVCSGGTNTDILRECQSVSQRLPDRYAAPGTSTPEHKDINNRPSRAG